MLFVGITGGVGAGKSEILNFIRENYNSRVMLTDEIAHDLMEPGTACYKQLKALFDTEVLKQDPSMQSLFEADEAFSVYQEDGTFHRPNLAKVIFSDDAKREALNAIVHPAVKQYVIEQYTLEKQRATACNTKDKKFSELFAEEWKKEFPGKRKNNPDCLDLLVVESALLIDDHYDAICEEMWYIYTSEDNRRARLKASRGYADGKIDSIFASQLSEDTFRFHCGEVIDNNGTTKESFKQIAALLAKRRIYPNHKKLKKALDNSVFAGTELLDIVLDIIS